MDSGSTAGADQGSGWQAARAELYGVGSAEKFCAGATAPCTVLRFMHIEQYNYISTKYHVILTCENDVPVLVCHHYRLAMGEVFIDALQLQPS